MQNGIEEDWKLKLKKFQTKVNNFLKIRYLM